MRSRSLRYATTLSRALRRRPQSWPTDHLRSLSTSVVPSRSKPVALRTTVDVTVRRSVLSDSGGTALSVTGPAARACEVLDNESDGEPLVLVVASNQTALRQALSSKALTHANTIGAIDALAFASDDQLHVVAAKLPPHVEAYTFDAKRGALPDLGRRRLETALSETRAPHFLLFGGDASAGDDEWDDEHEEDAALERFSRRVDGLFPHGTCAGAAARVGSSLGARLVHARRRPGNSGGRAKRAKRLKVFAAHKEDRPLVGVALLPREEYADAGVAAEKLGALCFGGSLRFHWAAGDGTAGPRAQRLRSAAIELYESWDRLDASQLQSLRSSVHPGAQPVFGDDALRSWDDLFGGAIRRRAPMSAARAPARLGLRAQDVWVDESLSLAVGSLSAPRLLGPGGALSSTAIFVEGATGAFEVAHHHASLADADEAI